ncbi:MAG: hypothetical protein K0R48_1107 [Gammaproteobacteria bacterium]|jgi:hypothetical protein|nr:hypothetical protein [Gammaproteobacteria bacterium]
MEIVTHNPAFAQVECIFFTYISMHFVGIFSKYPVYPKRLSTGPCVMTRGIALARRISASNSKARI